MLGEQVEYPRDEATAFLQTVRAISSTVTPHVPFLSADTQ
jgi:hypothetical protein